jgi:hypothetical protein
MLLQNADDLVFGEPAALHLWSSRLGQSLPQTGLGAGGIVNGLGDDLIDEVGEGAGAVEGILALF